MKTPVIVGLLIALLATPSPAELPPLLKPHAERYDRDRAALTASGEAALKPARERYLAALAAAQKVATAAVKTGDLAAIAAEIAGANGGAVKPEFPPDLPRSLATERKNFITATTNIEKAIPPKLRELATKYLQTLVALDAQALKTKDAELTEAAAAEKQRVLLQIEAAGGGQKNRNVVENGDFSAGKPGDWPPGWMPSVNWKRADDVSLLREGSEQFIRFRRLTASHQADVSPEKIIAIPANARAVEFSVRIRVKGLTTGKDYEYFPSLRVSTRDAAGEKVAEEHVDAKQDGGWKRFSGRCAVAANAKTLRIAVGPFGAAGVFDFDDVVVEFK
ncbi:MAG: hypothetical protein ABMA01_09815 [Chthoniobacteraceae bacterium]